MESRLALCVVVILALVVDGGKAQLDVCGVAPLNKRIIGGSDAEPGSWPWMASLHSTGSHRCGGTLINNMWILMSASCFGYFNISKNDIVYLGRQTQEGSHPNEVSRTNLQLLKHCDFNSKTKDNDIALLKLSPPVNFTDYIRPVCLAANRSDFSAGSTSWVTGWGTVNTGVPLPSPQSLQEVDVPFVSNKQCNADYVGEREVTDNMICAGQERKGTCFADSGGPLVVKQGKRWIQAGVVSWGDPACNVPIEPGVYTRVSRYQSWIEKQITSSKPVAPLPGFVYNSSNVISGRYNVFAMILLSILPLVLSLFTVCELF